MDGWQYQAFRNARKMMTSKAENNKKNDKWFQEKANKWITEVALGTNHDVIKY